MPLGAGIGDDSCRSRRTSGGDNEDHYHHRDGILDVGGKSAKKLGAVAKAVTVTMVADRHGVVRTQPRDAKSGEFVSWARSVFLDKLGHGPVRYDELSAFRVVFRVPLSVYRKRNITNDRLRFSLHQVSSV